MIPNKRKAGLSFNESFSSRFLCFCRYLQALSAHRSDAHLLRQIGELFDNQGDKSDALQYYFDVSYPCIHRLSSSFFFFSLKAYRHNPCDISTLEWLASYYIETQYPEKAVEFCAQAALVR